MGCDRNASGFRSAGALSGIASRFTRYAFETAGNAAVTTTCQGIVLIAPNQAATRVDAVARWDRDPGSHRRAKDAWQRRPTEELRGRRRRRHRCDGRVRADACTQERRLQRSICSRSTHQHRLHRVGPGARGHFIRQLDALRSARASNHRAQRRPVQDRSSREFYQLSHCARRRRGGAGLAHHPLSNLCVPSARRIRGREYLLSDRLTFWLGNLTALGLSLFFEPGAISLVDQLPPWLNPMLALALLLGVVAFLVWTWLSPRRFGPRRWPVRRPSVPVLLLRIAIAIFDPG